jgi:serine/threonine protein kinase
LGRGGQAAVFLVHDLTLKRDLAVKVLLPETLSSPAQFVRFRREAEMVAGLSHPNIVPLHFVGGEGDLFYLAMQYVDGGSLADRIAGGQRMSVDDATRAIMEVAGALAFAHKRGVVHRDIKPQNILVDRETGRCLVTDFGIARAGDTGGLTSTGLVVGTPAYIAPERAMGEDGDHRADVYAVGVMGFELLAGRRPFKGGSGEQGKRRRANDPPSLRALRPEVPRALEEVITECLRPDPEERTQTASDIVQVLSGATPSSGRRRVLTVRSARWSSPRTLWTALGATVTLGGLALLSSYGRAKSPNNRQPPAIDNNMALIAGGNYVIGSDSGPPIDRPRHVVQLAAFGIERNEVTVGEFDAFAQATGASRAWQGAMPDSQLPVTRVLWGDANGYCAWKHKDGGRLPTEEEWEAAARGPSGREFPWGGIFDAATTNTVGGARNALARVGSFPRGATPEGVHDLIGNVWEWTSSPLVSYPGGPALPDTMRQFRVVRGGAHNTLDVYAVAWHRGYGRPATRPDELTYTGFRCAMSVRP